MEMRLKPLQKCYFQRASYYLTFLVYFETLNMFCRSICCFGLSSFFTAFPACGLTKDSPACKFGWLGLHSQKFILFGT
jgi:hypothetical protein